MKATLLNTALVFIIVLNVQNQVLARPSLNSRAKRTDPYYGDSKARNGLVGINYQLAITMPVGGSEKNLEYIKTIGRKRRSETRLLETLLNQSEEDQENISDPRDTLQELTIDYK